MYVLGLFPIAHGYLIAQCFHFIRDLQFLDCLVSDAAPDPEISQKWTGCLWCLNKYEFMFFADYYAINSYIVRMQ